MHINFDFFKEHIKNAKSWIVLISLTLIYFLIFNIAFFTYKSNLLYNSKNSADENKLILINVLVYYVDWFIYFCIIPFISFVLINYLKKIKILNYFFQRDAYRNLYIFRYICLWLLSSFIILLIVTSSINSIFILFHFWIIGFNNIGFVFKVFLIKELLLILYIPFCFLIISGVIIISNKLSSIVFSSLFVILSLMNILHLTIVQKNISDRRVSYEIVDEVSKKREKLNFSFEDINLIAAALNNPIHNINFKNLNIINYKNEVIFDEYTKYMLNFCEGYNTEIVYVNKEIYPVCNVYDYKINNEYKKSDGINLIWKNLMKSEDFEKIMSNITVWFKESNNFYRGLEKFNQTLKNNYLWDDQKINELKFLVFQLDFKNGKLILKINNASDFQIGLINNFYKDIFYFYLINYISNPLEIDEITERSYIEVFQSFLYFKEYEMDYWLNVINSFLWKDIKNIDIEDNELRYIYKDFKRYGFNYFFKTNIEPSIYFNIINTIGIDKEIAYEYNLSFKKIRTYKLLDISSYNSTIFKSIININQYQKTLFKNIQNNRLMISELTQYNNIKFNIKSNSATINEIAKNNSSIIIIFILIVFMLNISIIFFIEFISYIKFRIINNQFSIQKFLKDIFKYIKK
ncbi:hypothetical protein [Spiroplasma endosymbiont of Cantharis rufa]|uniref:hypothetical protein n=1 Tax=Spiroplasma endosymbiont of Cantharis rufa TaxID=3066279 RepID=UPI0030D365CC